MIEIGLRPQRAPRRPPGSTGRHGRLSAWRAAAVAVALAASVAGCGDGAGPKRTLLLSECRLPRLPMAAQCGEVEVPEDRARPDGRRIRIFVAVLPANTLTPKRDPLFILAGGPGQAASHLGPFAALLNRVRKDRDIVLVDQRGTGRSSPLTCAAFKFDEGDIEAALELDPVPRAKACAAELAAQGVDAGQYTTAAWIADLDAVRAALGFDRINLWGGSYGTRAAMEYARRHPDRVRSLVLDGVAPPDMRISLEIWPTRDAVLDGVIAACRASAACREAHPDLAADLAALETRLGAGVDVELADPRTGETRTQKLRFDHVVGALQPLTYLPELQALIPEIVGRAAGGDFGPLYAAASLVTADLTDQINAALHYSVTCAEDVPRIAPGEAATALARVRTRELAQRLLAVCTVWPKGTQPADATTPFGSDIPTLIFSGGLDPVTPAANGARVAKTLPNSRHVVASGYAHIVSPHACAPQLIASFIDHPDFSTLPQDCVDHFAKSTRPPLWPDRMGAAP
jgi:pimeloyl-ACP methyl ester carboxylesterase